MDPKVLLLIVDGWGATQQTQYSAIAHARTPYISQLYKNYPHSQLQASGVAVGLPDGQMGNSEVGHMHLGAGREILQDLVRINRAIQSGELPKNPTLLETVAYAKQHQKPVHLIGLVSDGGVHAHINHLKALCSLLAQEDVPVFVHAFTDGRDTAPHSAIGFIDQLMPYQRHVKLATITGRYYAMDRDQRWERVQVAYDALVHGKGNRTQDWKTAIERSYNAGITDEFIQPIILTESSGSPVATIQPGDVVICFNFRTDRGRQITQVLTQTYFPAYQMYPLPLYYLTLTVYDETFKDVQSIFHKSGLINTLGEVLSQHEKSQLRIAETEKYPHVTYFFSGGREELFPGEERILCPSPQVATYDLAPAMSAYDVTHKITPLLDKRQFDFVCLNFANADMVGHTGVWQAAIEACEVVDDCVGQVVEHALKNNYVTFLVSDHGNAEQMLQEGSIYTAHTINPVPFIRIDPTYQHAVRTGTLIDIAPTILQAMHIPIPIEMEGRPL